MCVCCIVRFRKDSFKGFVVPNRLSAVCNVYIIRLLYNMSGFVWYVLMLWESYISDHVYKLSVINFIMFCKMVSRRVNRIQDILIPDLIANKFHFIRADLIQNKNFYAQQIITTQFWQFELKRLRWKRGRRWRVLWEWKWSGSSWDRWLKCDGPYLVHLLISS